MCVHLMVKNGGRRHEGKRGENGEDEGRSDEKREGIKVCILSDFSSPIFCFLSNPLAVLLFRVFLIMKNRIVKTFSLIEYTSLLTLC